MKKRGLLAFDIVFVGISPFISLILRENLTVDIEKFINIIPYVIISILSAMLCFVVFKVDKGIWRYTSLPDFFKIIKAVTVSILLALFIAFAINRLGGVARSVPLMQWAFVIAAMSTARLFVRSFYKKTNEKLRVDVSSQTENVVVVGLNQVTELYLRSVKDLAADSISVIGLLDEDVHEKGRLIQSHKVIGQPTELPQILAKYHIHGVEIRRVVITCPFNELSSDSREVLLRYERSGHVELDLFEKRLGLNALQATEHAHSKGSSPEAALGSQHVKSASQAQGLIGGRYVYAKRAIDFFCALSLLLVLSPVIALVSLLVALDLGFPLTFWQQRPGRYGKPFNLYKFRTMAPGHDRFGNQIPDECRLSVVGRFLRRARMDELPQLFNILIGEMSFVGPRPLLPIDQFPVQQTHGTTLRLQVRPGLTGWAQVNGGKKVSLENKMVMDDWYVCNASFWLDIKILIHTFVMVFAGDQLNVNAVRQAYEDLGIPQQEKEHTARGHDDSRDREMMVAYRSKRNVA